MYIILNNTHFQKWKNTGKNAKLTIYHVRSILAKVKYSFLYYFWNIIWKNYLIVKKWGGGGKGGGGENYEDVLFFWALGEDTLKEVYKIKRLNLKLEQHIIQKFLQYLSLKITVVQFCNHPRRHVQNPVKLPKLGLSTRKTVYGLKPMTFLQKNPPQTSEQALNTPLNII